MLNEGENINTPPTNIPTAVPSYEEAVKTIKKLKNNKVLGNNGIPAECIKSGGEILHKAIHKLIKTIWKIKALPDDWKEEVIVHIHKRKCTNYRNSSKYML